MNLKSVKSFFEKYEFLIPLILFVLFLVFTLPGISWGAPDLWHPDEIVVRSIKAISGEWQFSQTNFDYPDLPQYVMFGLGKILIAFGQTKKGIIIGSRILSAVLAGLTVVLTYIITRRMGGSVYIAGLSGLLLICVTLMPHNARFAHNDTYLVFFIMLAVLFLINYKTTTQRGWLYASFLTVGMAASSKYNGSALVIVPLLIYIIEQRHALFKLSTLETLFISGALTAGGFFIGTPTALTSMSFYFRHMIPALLHTSNYLVGPDSVRGIIGQYAVLTNGMGLFLFLLFAVGFVWAVLICLKPKMLNINTKLDPPSSLLSIILLAILAMDLPIMSSYNYQLRFFLPLMLFLAITAAFFVQAMYEYAKEKNIWFTRSLTIALVLLVLYSFARNISVMLLFMNDARFSAGAYINSLPEGTTIEYTLYPPTIPNKHFKHKQDYPIYFVKVPGDPIPTSRSYIFNAGEIGLDERQTDYFVTDNFTYDRFSDPYICGNMPAECDFFKQLNTGQSNHYKQIAEFSYSLPPYLPQITVQFVNPVIRVYQRMP
jgi:4-amino-4-deoxy-L-arabinose transferase-like glycosyltransferase